MADVQARLQAILDDFNEAVRVLRDGLQLISNGDGSADVKVMLLNSSIVSLSAVVEETIRSLLGEYLTVIRENYPDHRKLRADLQKANIDAAIDEIRGSKIPGGAVTMARIAANIEHCLIGRDDYILHVERLTYNKGNFKSGEVTSVFKRAGLSSTWQIICDHQIIADWTGLDSNDARMTEIINQWNAIFDERDLVAHRISQASGWSGQRISQSVELCQLVLGRVVALLVADANSLIGTAAGVGGAAAAV